MAHSALQFSHNSRFISRFRFLFLFFLLRSKKMLVFVLFFLLIRKLISRNKTLTRRKLQVVMRPLDLLIDLNSFHFLLFYSIRSYKMQCGAICGAPFLHIIIIIIKCMNRIALFIRYIDKIQPFDIIVINTDKYVVWLAQFCFF